MLLAKYEADQDENEELASQLTDAHIRLTVVDIFSGNNWPFSMSEGQL